MLRSLGVLMSALVAMAAQAQDASTTGGEKMPTPAARSAKTKRRSVVASRAPPVESGRPDAGVDAPTPEEPRDCGIGQWILSDEPAPVAVRLYGAGTVVALPQQAGPGQTWESRPEVWKAARCLDRYFIQLRSSSKEPWELKDAMLVGADGEVLKVTDLRSRSGKDQNINIVEVERTKGGAGPNYRLVALTLVGKDGRVAIFQNLELP